MSKWMDNWLYERDKKNKEKELDRCFRELMEQGGEICKKYKDISKNDLQSYLNCERTPEQEKERQEILGDFYVYYGKKKILEIDSQTIRKYPKLKEDIMTYIKKKDEFFSLCMDLDMMDEWKDDDLFDDYAGHHFGWYL